MATRVDTKQLEYFSDVDQLRFILKHPVLSSFLEMELNHLKTGYIIEFLLYLLFVLVIFKYFGERFTSIKQVTNIYGDEVFTNDASILFDGH